MKKPGSGVPAWMVAQALVIKAKNVLLEEAIELLYREIDEKRMAISGSFMPMELEKSGEMEQGVFLIRHLMDQRPKIIASIGSQIKEMESRKSHDAKTIEKIESAKKFLVAVEKISMYMTYGMVFEQWFNDVSMAVKENDATTIIAKTSMTPESYRVDALRFLVGSEPFKRKELFSDEERRCLESALELCKEKG